MHGNGSNQHSGSGIVRVSNIFVWLIYTVEPLYNGHHWDPTFCLLQRGVPNSGASDIFPVGVVLRNSAVECNVAVISELSFAVNWQERLSRG